jgi:hypothetical protein
VRLSVVGSSARWIVGGVETRLQARRGDNWVDAFLLLSGGGGRAAGWRAFPLPPDFGVRGLGLPMPVWVTIPPVEPGDYRIVRAYTVTAAAGARATPLELTAELHVVA